MTDQPNILLAKKEIQVNRDIKVLGDELMFNQDGTQFALVIQDRDTHELMRCIAVNSLDLSIAEQDFIIKQEIKGTFSQV